MRALVPLLFALLLGAQSAGAGAVDSDLRQIFNGRDLTGWEGDPRFWSVIDGCIRGETRFGALPKDNTFLIYRGAPVRDFELRLKFRLQNGNSGVQYRARDLGKHVVSGYQAEIENKQGKAGFLYEEKGRGWLARVGEKAEAAPTGKPHATGTLATQKALIAQGYYRMRDWNEYRIVARGNRLQHFLNGFQTVEFIDNDPARRALEGLLALQIHAGPPMIVEFKDILIKHQ
jgi:hypothetical protein